MNSLPKIYLIDSVDCDKCPYPDVYINNFKHVPEWRTCKGEDCIREDVISHRLLISYEYEKMKLDKPAFFYGNDDYNLVTTTSFADQVSELLGGCVPHRIGIAVEEHNHGFVDEKDWFTFEPHFSEQMISGRCGLVYDSSGKPLERCDACPHQKRLDYSLSIADQFLSPTQWDGSDIFKIDCSFRPVLTSRGVDALLNAGFNPLNLVELKWAPESMDKQAENYHA